MIIWRWTPRGASRLLLAGLLALLAAGANATASDDGVVLHDTSAPPSVEGPSIAQRRALAAGQWDDPKQMYDASCARCHDGSVGPVLFGRYLPAQYFSAVARTGVGAMLPYRPSEYSDADLEALGGWIAAQPAPATPQPTAGGQ